MHKTDNTEFKPIVLHVLIALDFGGVEKHIEVIANNANHSEYDHLYCVIGNGGRSEQYINNINNSVMVLNSKTKIPSLISIFRIYKVIKKLNPSVVHTHGGEANFHGLIASFLARTKLRIAEEIGIPKHSKKARLIFRQIYRLAHQVIGISDSVCTWLVNNKEVSKDKVVKLYNPVEIPESVLLKIYDKSRFRVGFVGRLEEVKNALSLLFSVHELNNKGYPIDLWLVGDGSQKLKIEEYIEKHKLHNLVKVFGYKENPYSYMQHCDLYIQPSISEGFGIALVEAMSVGLPVIATSVGGAPEIIKDGTSGWLINKTDAATISSAILVALMNKDQLLSMGEAAKSTVIDRFTPVSYLKKLDNIYNNS